MRSTCCVIIEDTKRGVDFVLEVPFEAHEEVPVTYSAWSGWSPPEGGGVEIDGVVKCTEITTWAGDYGYSAKPGLDDANGSEAQVGEYCLEKYRNEIQEKVEAEANKMGDDGPDPDDLRDAFIERQRLRDEERRGL